MKSVSKRAARLMVGAAGAACLVFGIAHELRAELAPGEYRRMQRDAPEEFKIAVVRVRETPVGESPRERERGGRAFDIDVEAKVLRVARSAVRVRDGENIHIVYRIHRRERAIPGPGEPPVLERGRECPAYLAKVEGQRRSFRPAAGAYSFERVGR